MDGESRQYKSMRGKKTARRRKVRGTWRRKLAWEAAEQSRRDIEMDNSSRRVVRVRIQPVCIGYTQFNTRRSRIMTVPIQPSHCPPRQALGDFGAACRYVAVSPSATATGREASRVEP